MLCLRVGFLTGSWCSNRGSLALYPVFFFTGSFTQEAIQERGWCEVADDPVVVIKFRPMKASNGVEDKTGMTGSSVCRGHDVPKAIVIAKG